MAKPYSYDLRQKVMQAIELDGLKRSEASELSNISRNTINLWFQRKAETGDVQVKPRLGLANPGKITDWQKFQAFVKKHEDRTQVEMAELWDGKISSRTISRGLEKIGFTRKKTYGYRQQDEAKRAAFLTRLGDLKAPHRVYVDEIRHG